MTIAIVGSRSFDDYQFLCEKIEQELKSIKDKNIKIISGGARGADKLGEQWAKENGYEFGLYPAYWQHYGKSAGYIRNKAMAKEADMVIAFWDGNSPGTQHMLNITKQLNKQFKIYWNDPKPRVPYVDENGKINKSLRDRR